ncbi:MAG: PD-(D/E)XK nuclease family protein [Brevinematales bacterium]
MADKQTEKFLKRVAYEMLTTHREKLSSSLILVPNKRTRTFLFEYFREITDTPFVAPICLSSEEYASTLSGLEKAERIPLLFELYQSYEKIYRENNKTPFSFEDFYFLGTTLLGDFDEIDRYLIDIKEIYKHLSSLQEYEKNAPTIPSAFIDLWDSLGEIYNHFTQQCLQNKKGYSGLVYRKAVEATKNQLHPIQQKASSVFWIGFHALSPAEEQLFLSTKEKNLVFLDMDKYFTEDEKQEAGLFYRTFWKKHLPSDISYLDDLLSEKKHRTIHIFATTNETTMVKLVGDMLQNQLQNPSPPKKKRPDELAIVLPREELLFSVLNSLPPDISSVNVTMGFPLKASHIASWIDLLLSLWDSISDMSPDSNEPHSLSGSLLLEVLDHQYTRLLFDNDTLNTIISHVREKNISRVPVNLLATMSPHQEGNNLFSQFVCWYSKKPDGTQTLESIFELTKEVLKTHRQREFSFDMEFIYTALQRISEIQQLVTEKKLVLSFDAVAKILRDVIAQTTIAFSGEPLEGWQIMGMLETQALDFDIIYILSMNEGIMPAPATSRSFIPQDIRKAYNLPQAFETEAIYAYHFYRLLKRSKEVYLFYTQETRDTGLQEKSRYLEQILFEYAGNETLLVEKTYTYPFTTLSQKIISYPKTEAIQKKLLSLSYSASSIKTYFTCSLWFYYQYILGVRKTETLEEDPDAAVKGTIIHSVLEALFRPYKDEKKIIETQDISQMKASLSSLTETAIKQQFTEQPIAGKLALLHQIITQQLEKVLESHQNYTPFQVVELETEFTGTIDVADHTLQLKSRLDRMDIHNDSLTIIDYKTGQVDTLNIPTRKSEDNSQTIDEEFLKTLYKNSARSQLFQLLFYAFLVKNAKKKRTGDDLEDNPYQGQEPSLLICSIKKGTFETVKRKDINNPVTFGEEIEAPFVSGLKNALEIILSNELFTQTNDEKNCKYCPFQEICGRKGE